MRTKVSVCRTGDLTFLRRVLEADVQGVVKSQGCHAYRAVANMRQAVGKYAFAEIWTVVLEEHELLMLEQTREGFVPDNADDLQELHVRLMS